MENFNGMSSLRKMVVDFMENDGYCTHLRDKGWYGVEDAICNFVCQLLGTSENDKIFSKCDKAEYDDSPTIFEEKIYRKVSKHYHIQDILNAIEDEQSARLDNDEPKLMFKVINIKEMTDDYENKITGEENILLAKDVLYDYMEENYIEVED